MTDSLVPCVAGTVILWAASAVLALVFGAMLCMGSVASGIVVRAASLVLISASRGIPTSLFIVCSGVAAGRVRGLTWLPSIFPGTPYAFRLVAWALVMALAAGSAGHLAMVFRSAYRSLGRGRLEQTTVLGLALHRRTRLVVREAAVTALAPTGTRLVHHLHNTAFASLFPVTELFGGIQERINATYKVIEYVGIGTLIYVAMSAAIWGLVRGLEAAASPAVRIRMATPEGLTA